MNNEQIKSLLISIKPTETDFSVIMTGKESKKVNGFYKPDTHEIFIHNLNFQNENCLIYTAIHEYAHHLITVSTKINESKKGSKVHNTQFWVTMDELLDIAIEKGLYQRKHSKEIEEKINAAKKLDQEIAKLQQQLGSILHEIQELSEKEGERFEDITTHEIGLKQSTVKTSIKSSAIKINNIGQDVLNICSKLNMNSTKTELVNQSIKEGKSVEQIKNIIQQNKKDISPIERLEKEKVRLEKTISQLNQRLEYVNEALEAA